jgi:hypothetical protein
VKAVALLKDHFLNSRLLFLRASTKDLLCDTPNTPSDANISIVMKSREPIMIEQYSRSSMKFTQIQLTFSIIVSFTLPQLKLLLTPGPEGPGDCQDANY